MAIADVEIVLRALANYEDKEQNGDCFSKDVLRRGIWETVIDPDGYIEGWLHKECGKQVTSKEAYCPNCGARMGKK